MALKKKSKYIIANIYLRNELTYSKQNKIINIITTENNQVV